MERPKNYREEILFLIGRAYDPTCALCRRMGQPCIFHSAIAGAKLRSRSKPKRPQ
jgi:hypothetical protein